MMIATNIYKHMKTKILLLKSLRCSLSCFKDAISSFFCLIACLWDSMAFAIICCLKSPDVSSLRSALEAIQSIRRSTESISSQRFCLSYLQVCDNTHPSIHRVLDYCDLQYSIYPMVCLSDALVPQFWNPTFLHNASIPSRLFSSHPRLLIRGRETCYRVGAELLKRMIHTRNYRTVSPCLNLIKTRIKQGLMKYSQRKTMSDIDTLDQPQQSDGFSFFICQIYKIVCYCKRVIVHDFVSNGDIIITPQNYKLLYLKQNLF